jgi:hypothetical protein
MFIRQLFRAEARQNEFSFSPGLKSGVIHISVYSVLNLSFRTYFFNI